MLEPGVREAVDALITAVRERPSEFPIAEILALRAAGYEVTIETGSAKTVAYMVPIRGRPPWLELLTPREREVAMLVAAGYSNSQIAATLVLSVATVKDHMNAVLNKSGLESRTQVAAAWYGGLDEDLLS